MDHKRSYGRLVFLIVSALIALVAAYYGGDVVRESEKPSEYIGLVFSILAASLFAVVSIIGDPSMLLPGNSRTAWENAKVIQADLREFNYLFIIYLSTLGLLVFSEIIEYKKLDNFYFIHNIFVFFAVFGFLISLALPFALSAIQKSRLENEIKARTKKLASSIWLEKCFSSCHNIVTHGHGLVSRFRTSVTQASHYGRAHLMALGELCLFAAYFKCGITMTVHFVGHIAAIRIDAVGYSTIFQ
ncbi:MULTISPECIES: hypothetical protein [unclassified Mesorhizobium]|uniref:hypothetical protein n=1 Tax=unclassified Mesorhizobium TaxID=325217 RepID=UPI003336F60D